MTDNVLDTEFLRTLREDAFGPEGEEDFKDILKTYVATGEINLKQIPEALDRNDQSEATRLAHSLKGSSASVGAVKMAAASKALELALKSQGKPDADIQNLLETMKTEFAAACLALQKYIQS